MDRTTKRAAGLRVGELARRTGLTVRTLHWYDSIRLLRPSRSTEAGHRLYTDRDVARLQQIASLRQLGLSLDEIRSCLDGPGCSLPAVIELQIERLRERIADEQRLCRRLEALAGGLRAAGGASVDDLVTIMEMMNRMDKYYKSEHLEELARRREQFGDAGIRRAETDWAELIANVRAEYERGTDPADPRVRALARQWRDLVNAFTGGNPEIAAGLNRMWREETNIHGVDTAAMRPLGDYVQRALAADDGE